MRRTIQWLRCKLFNLHGPVGIVWDGTGGKYLFWCDTCEKEVNP